ncbi:response regulator [Pseudactinotalea sp. HY160]|uniref:response regulator transcription factor n=1 Tax=Pseudactinotalea sp. HY160 TaxID=2654490 RepID=UPI00128BA225|nr:response regulator transcription factor [Pseudactinotalea sp. HY160]MPV49110.1 response regulator [Pseudactinotalea sp. HY160]
MRLLIVEDEIALSEAISTGFRAGGYEVDVCTNGAEARERCLVEEYDLILLDLSLPGADGLDVLRALRSVDPRTPVLVLSARSRILDKVGALDLGANDYLTKPFHFDELEARVRSLTRRRFEQQGVLISCGDLAFDTKSRVAVVNGDAITLTRKEAGLLEYLIHHQDSVVSQDELLEHVWDSAVPRSSNSVRVHVSSLRKKVRVALGRDPIRNRVGHGYTLTGTDA